LGTFVFLPSIPSALVLIANRRISPAALPRVDFSDKRVDRIDFLFVWRFGWPHHECRKKATFAVYLEPLSCVARQLP